MKTEKVYFLENNEVKSSSFEDFVKDYGIDLVTGPNGCVHKYQIIPSKDGEIWYLKEFIGNSFVTIDWYYKKEDAEEALFKTYLRNIKIPYYFSPVACLVNEYCVSEEVAKSLLRKMEKRKQIVELRRKRELEVYEEIEKRKEQERINSGFSKDLKKATIEQFPSIKDEIGAFIRRNNIKVTNKSANRLAWRFSQQFVGDADIPVLSYLIKKEFRDKN